jgi:pimeloyl-ACP methyl ester carboxylesterase
VRGLAAWLIAGLVLPGSGQARDVAPPTGDRHVAYTLAPGVESAYRLFVPEAWRPGERWPLVVILHGGGGTENSPFDRTPEFKASLEAAARAHRFVLLSPRGHKGWWGADMRATGTTAPMSPGAYRMPPAGAITAPPPKLEPLSAPDRQLAERDVWRSIAAVQATYGTDPRRVYLMGNSMGSVGTLHLAQAEPQRWCAIAPSDGPLDPADFPYQRVRRLRAALFVHGDDDRVAPVESMRALADGFERVGVPTRFLVVEGGGHSDSWQRSLATIFDFFSTTDCRRLPPRPQ